MFEKEIQSLENEMMTMFKDFHRNPELGYMEHRTSNIVAEFLEECGLEVKRQVALTGVVGILDSGKPGKTVLLRADMDCLAIQELSDCAYKSENKGKMHACGHDSHVTMLLYTAKVLSQHKEAFSGKVKFVFQPSEEGTPSEMIEEVKKAGYNEQGGAGFMIQQGVLDGVDACMIMHVQPAYPVGKVSISKRNAAASSDVFNISIIGKGGHGAQPQKAVDPVPALAETISAIHMLPTREVSAVETCVISIGKVETPGSVWNAVAEKAVISGGYRTFNQEVRKLLGRRIEELAQGIAKANNCMVQIDRITGYRSCINDEKMALLVKESCEKTLGADNVIYTDIPAMTSDDGGAYLEKVPGVYFWLGVGDGQNVFPLHNPRFMMNPKALTVGTLVQVNNIINVLSVLNR